jgi:hypothetical protein
MQNGIGLPGVSAASKESGESSIIQATRGSAAPVVPFKFPRKLVLKVRKEAAWRPTAAHRTAISK